MYRARAAMRASDEEFVDAAAVEVDDFEAPACDGDALAGLRKML